MTGSHPVKLTHPDPPKTGCARPQLSQTLIRADHLPINGVNSMLSGQCNCGGVAFEIAGQLSPIYACHCSICRRFTGGANIPVVIVRNADFRWIAGRDLVTVWQKPDADWESNFCSICGSALPGQNDPARMFVPAGLLAGDIDGLQIAHHIFVGSKADWDVIGDAGKQHAGLFGG